MLIQFVWLNFGSTNSNYAQRYWACSFLWGLLYMCCSCESLIDMYSTPRDLADVTLSKLAPTRLSYFSCDMDLPLAVCFFFSPPSLIFWPENLWHSMSRFLSKNLFKLVKAKCVYCFHRITVTKREDNEIPSRFIHDIKTKGLFRYQCKCIAAQVNIMRFPRKKRSIRCAIYC